MKTPREKYMHDEHYHRVVDMMVNMIHECKFTPSELREMSILASIIYEEQSIEPKLRSKELPDELDSAFGVFDKWVKQSYR